MMRCGNMFQRAGEIALRFKKELTEFGYQVGKISMKEQTVEFIKE